MRVRNWKFFYKKEHIFDTISLWCGIGFLWYAVYSMIQERFPSFVETGIGSAEVVLWLLLLWMGSDWPKTYLKKWSLLCFFAGMAIPIVYTYVHAEALYTGAVGMLQSYLEYWNDYYGAAIFVAGGDIRYAPLTFRLIEVLLWWLLWNVSYVLRNKVLLSFFPVLFLVLEMIVGLSPRGDAIVCIFLGAMCLLHLGGTDIKKKIIILCTLVGCIWFSKLSFSNSIEYLTSEEKKQEVLYWQDTFLEMDVKDILSLDYHFPMEPLGNQTPSYQGEVLLEIEAEEYPLSSIYLKGFHGTTYKNGIWSTDDRAFKKICRTNSYSQKELAEHLFDMPFEALKVYYSEYEIGLMEQEYVIRYVGSSGDVAYVPYFSKWDSLNGDVVLKSDYLLKKAVGKDMLSVNTLQSIEEMEALIALGENAASSAETEVLNTLSAAYCENQESFSFFAEAVEQITRTYTGEGVNSQRLAYAKGVKKYLSEQMSYSLILDTLPQGADPVEYAVTQGHEGYCMHFASAGTMLLRELGVPARYVSGYVVVPSDFEASEQKFFAKVTDYAAHAWVEIYLENVGWIPYEMTPGYTVVDTIPTKGNTDDYEEQSEERKDAFEQLKEELTEETQTDIESGQESEESDINHTDIMGNGNEEDIENSDLEQEEENSLVTEEDKNGETHTGNTNKDESSFHRKEFVNAIFRVAGILILIIGSYWGVRRWFSYYENILQIEMKKNLTRRAVKHMNQRIYHMVRLKDLKNPESNLQKGYWTDVRMEEKLIEYYDCVEKEDWKRYMDIVKKMHYSKEVISKEDMRHCYNCYRKVWRLTIRKQRSAKNK